MKSPEDIECPYCSSPLEYCETGKNYPCERCGILWRFRRATDHPLTKRTLCMNDDFEEALKATRGQECERGGACKFKSLIEQMCPYCQSKVKPHERFTDGLREVYLHTPPRNEHPV